MAFTPTDVWAVGGRAIGSSPILVERWNGQRWTAKLLAVLGHAAAISGTSSRDLWIAGAARDGRSPLFVHYDGRSWSVIPGPVLPNDFTYVRGLVALARDDVWAVGTSSSPADERPASALIMHWDGKAWSTVNAPAGTRSLSSVDATSPRDVWAVGEYDLDTNAATIVRWDGTAWHSVANEIHNVDLTGVDAVSANDVWAAGSEVGPAASVAHWNGQAFRVVRRVGAGTRDATDILSDVAAAGRQAWAVGAGLAEHWDGRRWRGTRLPGVLWAADALSPRNIWAVGESALIRHYACR